MKTIIFGQNGKVGRELFWLCHARKTGDDVVIGLSSIDCDLRNPMRVFDFIIAERPDVVINAAAMNGMENVERDPHQGYLINAASPGAMAQACKRVKALFVHYSTDYVFSGAEHGLFEHTHRDPIGAYGQTKAAGEDAVALCGDMYFIFRLSSVWGREYSGPLDVVNQAVTRHRGSAEDPVQVLHQYCAPTSGRLIAAATMHAVDTYFESFDGHRKAHGIYHLATSAPVWKRDHANYVLGRVLGSRLPGATYPGFWKIKEGTLAVKRPVHSFLITTKFQEMFGYPLPNWQDDFELTMPLLPAPPYNAEITPAP